MFKPSHLGRVSLFFLAVCVLTAGCASDLQRMAAQQTAEANPESIAVTTIPTAFPPTTPAAAPTFSPESATPAGIPDPQMFAELDAAVRQFADSGRFMGAVLVEQNGRILLSEGFGLANVEQNIPDMPSTEFEIGSLTKQFTAAAILQLQDEGRLAVQDPLADYLPEYPGGAGITLHHLLSHTSGVPEHVNLLMDSLATPYPVDELIATFSGRPADFAPGARFEYSNSNYVLLGKVIEVVTGQPYAAYIQEHIFNPIHMDHSSYGQNQRPPEQAIGYAQGPGSSGPARFVDMSIPYAAGALVSTVEDLYLWDRALRGNELLSPAGLEMMFTPGPGGYGYGWFIEGGPSGRVAYHGGSIFGYRSYIRRGLDADYLIVVLSNLDSAPVPDITAALEDVLIN